MRKKCSVLLILLLITESSFSQIIQDSITPQILKPVSVELGLVSLDIKRLESVQGTYIFSGKKNEVIEMSQKNVALTEKYGRQVFAKIPGVFVYDMDGTGNQINISTRGLDAHRGWEFNNRKDGILTNSDMYGYPASHYNIPMEAVERIELVRGTGSLQYGAQFGGMLNYVSKLPDTTKQISFESINTIGSYGLVSTYSGLSGKVGKFRYSVWTNKKWITGYRENNDANFDAEQVAIFYDPSKNFHVKVEWTHSNYVTHLPGPLTDSMFHQNPKSSTRARNYYNPNIHIPSLNIIWNLTPSLKLQITSSAVIGKRNSVLFDKPATISDSIVTTSKQFNNRQVDQDEFNSYTSEARILQNYKFLNNTNSLAFGIQYLNNDLHRQQQGKGTTGNNFDLSLVKPGWGRNLHYKTQNISLSIENRWVITKKFSVNTGARIEMGETKMSGTIKYYSDSALPNTIKHKFPLLGLSAQYDFNKDINVYSGYSQAYRPVIFKDIIPQSTYEFSNKNLKDALGNTAELGIRGKWKMFKWDISGFVMQYNNRIGTLALTDSNSTLLIYRTNIGNSRTKGIEFFLQCDLNLGKKSSLSVFTSSANINATYQNASIKSGSKNVNISGNQIESVPNWISRNGMTLKYSIFSFTALYSYTSKSFADPLNTIKPDKNGAIGLVPSYRLLDLNIALRLTDKIKLTVNANNILNEIYFTKRPQFYPGPGIWSSDGRTFSGTIAIKI